MQFLKMEGLGNDFILTHGLTDKEYDRMVKKTVWLCDRRKGIGADGVIVVLPPTIPGADYRMRIFNSDGSEAEMCGNGIRCFAKYLTTMKINTKSVLSIETAAGMIKTEFMDNGLVGVDMGAPVLEADKIPTAKTRGRVILEPIIIDKREFRVTAVSMGNPHAVIFADALTDDLVWGYGKKLESHYFFPKKVNVEFVKIVSDSEIEMRVFERGCGETMACGTGACAAVVAGILNNKIGHRVTVHLLGGDLLIAWDGETEHSVFMTGPATEVFRGEVEL